MLARAATKDFFEEALDGLPLKNEVVANFFFKK